MNQYTEIIFLVGSFSLLTLLAYLVHRADLTLQVKKSANWSAVSYIIQSLYACVYLLTMITAILVPKDNFYKNAVIISAIVGLSLLIPFIRRILAKLIPIQPDSQVHTFALLTSILIPITLFQSLIDPVSVSEIQKEEITFVFTFSTLWIQNILSAIFAIIGVGYLSKRDWQQTKERLGLRRLTLGQVGTAIGVAGLFFILQAVLTIILTKLGLSPDEEVLKVNEALMSPLFNSAIGILSIGLAAALGEELVFRGALQPRFGLILTSILFTLTHANYGLSLASIIVLVLGLGLGYFRQRFSTSYTMVIHASYNILVGIIGDLFS